MTNRDRDRKGINTWFQRKGVGRSEIIKEVMYAFCEKYGFENLQPNTPTLDKVEFCAKRFQVFTSFAGNYLNRNNYKFKRSEAYK